MTQIGRVLSHAGKMQALVFVGDAMEDLPTFTPASLACRYFCFGKGTTRGRPERFTRSRV